MMSILLRKRRDLDGPFWPSVANINILGVITEKPYRKLLERNVVYIPIITYIHVTSIYTMALYCII